MTLSKQKGNSFERKIANLFSETFEKHTGISNAFRRNIDSGSFFGAKNQKRIETHLTDNACFGDIMTPDSFKFSIECKHYKTPPSFSALVKQEFKLFDTWIAQAKQDAANAEKAMLVVIKFNNVPEFVIVEGADGEAFATYKGNSLISMDEWLKRDITYFFEV